MQDQIESHVINTQDYPIIQPESHAYRKLIDDCRSRLDENGLCLLPNFINPVALEKVQQESLELIDHAHYTEHWRATPNGAIDDESKLATQTRAAMSSIAYDKLSSESPLRTLYQSDSLVLFLNDLFDRNTLYRTDDTLVSCMLTVLMPGDELGWHYDPNDIVVSLAIQQSDTGGEFEFAPRIRAPAAQAKSNEAAVLNGTYSGTISKSLEPGTLSLFNGHRSLHRVAPVGPGRPRIIALFNYSEEPGYRFSEQIQQTFFGRVATG